MFTSLINRSLRLVFLMASLITCISDVFGQDYYDLFVRPRVFHNVHKQDQNPLALTSECTAKDSLKYLVKIEYGENGSVSVKNIYFDGNPVFEESILMDELLRIEEWKYGLTQQVFQYRYPEKNAVDIEYFDGHQKKSISHLTFFNSGKLKEFKQRLFFDGDSVADHTYTVRYKCNMLIINQGIVEDKYEFNSRGDVVSQTVNDELLFDVEYSKSGRVLSATSYFYSPLTEEKMPYIANFYTYSRDDRLSSLEFRLHNGEGVIRVDRCNFNLAE